MGIALALLFVVVVLVLKYGVLPRIEDRQADIVAKVSQASGMTVEAQSIRAGWTGFRPYVELEGVLFREPPTSKSPTRTAGAIALALPGVRAELSVLALLVGQVRLAEVTAYAPELMLARGQDGLLYFAGRALNAKQDPPDDGRLLTWLLEQPNLKIERARMTWRDEMTAADDLVFSDVGISIEKRRDGHRLGIVATPPRTLAEKIDLRGQLELVEGERGWQANGKLFVEVRSANLLEAKRHVQVPDQWQTGIGSARAWVSIDSRTTTPGASPRALSEVVRDIVADVQILDARAQLADDVAPINVSRLSGRLNYRAEAGGFTVGSKALELKTREGVTLPPADFSFALHNANDPSRTRGELSGNGIDLKVMSSLIEYFPVGKETRAVFAKYGLRGQIQDSKFAWTGPLDKPRTYRVKGALVDFAANAQEKVPGVAGFTGRVEGDEKGGTFSVDSKQLALEVPKLYTEPLRFLRLSGAGAWQQTANELAIEVKKLDFATGDVSGELTARYTRAHDAVELSPGVPDPGQLDLSLRLAETRATNVAKYFPLGLSNTRDYLDWAVRDGEIKSVEASLKGRLAKFPFRNGEGGSFKLSAKLKDIDFRYAVGWPAANDIDAVLEIHNTRIFADVASARIYNARVGRTSLELPDFAVAPSVLTIKGDAAARGEDVTRFLRESPLANTVGTFTRVATFEGAGRLSLDFSIPMGVAYAPKGAVIPTFKLNGRYQFLRASAKLDLSPSGTVVSNVQGSVNFTESSVKSVGLTAVAFGNPLAVSVSGGGRDAITTEFTARAELIALGDLIPFRLPNQVVGATDFTGKVVSRESGTDVAIESLLLGVTSALPSPLAKRPDEQRRLAVSMTGVGKTNESIRVNLAGNFVAGSESAESRIDARFKRRPAAAGERSSFFGGVASVAVPVTGDVVAHGLWLSGNLRRLDFDQWQKAIASFVSANASPAPAANSAGSGSGGGASGGDLIAGFDFKLDTLLAYGRPFRGLALKGRRAGEVWAMDVDSAEAKGDFTWRAAAFNDRGAVRARLEKFVLSEELESSMTTATPGSGGKPEQGSDLPALDIVAEEFVLKGRWLGKLELQASPQAANWRIDKLVLSNGHVRVEMDGLWQRYGDPYAPPIAGELKSLTNVNVKLVSNNLNALFGQFGYADYMSGGKASLEGKLSWPGHTYQMQLTNLSGEFKLSSEKGQFAKIQPGAGKLLGLLSLQSLSRRLSFDFRDVFSEGFGYDTITGDVRIREGIMFTENFTIVGPAATIRMAGDISLPAERQNLQVTVAPKLGETVALAAGVLGTPILGGIVYLGQKIFQNPIEKLASAQYAVTGTWDNPHYQQTGRTTVPREPTKATEPASSAAPTSAPTNAAPTPNAAPARTPNPTPPPSTKP